MGSQELRERSLVAGDHDPCLDITDLQYCLLEVVGSGRHHGVLRPFITTKYMKIDARSTFHHVKKLRQAGLVTVKVYSFSPRLQRLPSHLNMWDCVDVGVCMFGVREVDRFYFEYKTFAVLQTKRYCLTKNFTISSRFAHPLC